MPALREPRSARFDEQLDYDAPQAQEWKQAELAHALAEATLRADQEAARSKQAIEAREQAHKLAEGELAQALARTAELEARKAELERALEAQAGDAAEMLELLRVQVKELEGAARNRSAEIDAATARGVRAAELGMIQRDLAARGEDLLGKARAGGGDR